MQLPLIKEQDLSANLYCCASIIKTILSILFSEELRNLYSALNISLVKSETRWTGHVARMVEITNSCKIFIRKIRMDETP
jgi:hypothetical protein